MSVDQAALAREQNAETGAEVSPPKITNFNPLRVGVEVSPDAVTLVGFLPAEVVTFTIAREAWVRLAQDAEEQFTGIQVVRKPGIVVPGR